MGSGGHSKAVTFLGSEPGSQTMPTTAMELLTQYGTNATVLEPTMLSYSDCILCYTWGVLRLQSARSQLGDLLRVWFVLRRPLSPGAERLRIRVLQRGRLDFTINARRSFEGGHFLGFGARVTDDADDGNGAAYAVRHKCDSP